MPNASFRSVGPAIVLLGDPTTTNGDDMVHLGDTEDVGFDAGIRNAFTSSSRLNGTPTAGGLYVHAPRPEAQVQLMDANLDILKALIRNSVLTAAGSNASTSTTDTLGGGDDFQEISPLTVPTLCILPVTEVGDGVEAAHAIWFPATTIEGLDGIQFGRVPEGEIQNPYNVRFMAAKRDTDQDGTAIPPGHRIWFMGPPANLGLTWSLPPTL